MIEWRFKPNARDDKNVDPIQGEFFTTRDVDHISKALIREGIQNALDERDKSSNNQVVRVRVFLSGEKYAIPSSDYLPFFPNLLPHLKAPGSGLNALPDFASSMKFLVFEDFNTKGLDGDPEEGYVADPSDKSAPHNFYYFWRNVGRSGKSEDQLGRWGLGKTVFPACSRINTFWGVTVRKDQRKLLMGQSVLRMHNVPDKPEECGYKPYGDYGNFKSNDCFASPIEDRPELTTFETLFRLQRTNQAGLSVVVPFCTDELSLDHLGYAVIEQYFYPILEGRLEVEITEEDKTILLNKADLLKSLELINLKNLSSSEVMKVRAKEELEKLFDFANWAIAIQQEELIRLNDTPQQNKPRWVPSLFNEEVLEAVRDRFENGERIAFSVPLWYQPEKGEAVLCRFNAFIEKDLSLKKPENFFVRDGITISGITSLDKGTVRGMVVIQDSNLARMLGDSENPAHTEWQKDSRNFKGKYINGSETLVFVKNTLKQLYNKLQRPITGLQKDLLVDFFSIPIEPEEKKAKEKAEDRKKPDDHTEDPEIEIELLKRPRPILIEKTETGLRLYKNQNAKDIPDGFTVRLGYDVPKGNPITSYQEFDFDVDKKPIRLNPKGIYIEKKEKNYLELTIEDKENFEIELSGFDPKRDLFVKVN
jgi:hypothetical protein